MALRFQCQACQAIKAVNPRLLGKQISCPECGAPVQLPTQQQIDQTRQARQQSQRLADAARRQAMQAAAVEPAREATQAEIEARQEREYAAANTSFTKPKIRQKEDMDMTPMVDVTFLLLIFFMITASFSVQKSVQRPAPRDEDPSVNAQPLDSDENPDIVTVQVDEFNAFNVITTQWDRVAGSKQDLIVTLNDAHDVPGRQPTKLVVQAHEDCIHSSVIAALDAGREAQFESFEVSTVEQFD